MKKIIDWFKRHMPTKRKIIQLYAALLFNANIKGYITGSIYTGPLKNICAPGINCYSCPGASASCPLGALQNALASSNKRLPYYLFGIILLYGIIAGRWICGWLCPFGWIQELLHKIPTPKLKKGKITRILSYFKYVILVVFVFIFPLMYMLRDVPLPAFCKYICPAGTIEGAVGLLANKVNDSMFSMLGPLFTWKFVLLVSFLVASVFIYRFFCRFFCPLGALYGLFNKISFFGIKLEKSKCTNCSLCVSKCKMDIAHVGDQECISCGECIDVCPTGAISWKGSKIILHENEIVPTEDTTPIGVNNQQTEQTDHSATKTKKRFGIKKKTLQIIAAVLMVALLGGALVYYNFLHEDAPVTLPTEDSIDFTKELVFELSPDGSSYTVVGIDDTNDTVVYIPSVYSDKPVSAISSGAFKNKTQFESIYIPYSVTTVGAGAFEGCSDLRILCEAQSKPEGFVDGWCVSESKVVYTGSAVGMLCPTYTLDLYNGEKFNVKDNYGKLTVINFWGTWCTPCVAELPHFNRIASEYEGQLSVVAIHSPLDVETGGPYIEDKYPGTKMIIAKDVSVGGKDYYYSLLGGKSSYPMTLILDEDGVILFHIEGGLDYDTLKTYIDFFLES